MFIYIWLILVKNKEELMVGVTELAKTIAEKSPVAIYAIKKVLNN
jgi:hypothetical protein